MSTNKDKVINSMMDPRFFEITGWTIDYYDGDPVELDKTRYGQPIDGSFHKLATVELPEGKTRTSATCAASKIAINHIKSSNLNDWNLTELVVGFFEGRKLKAAEAAKSCVGCNQFLPCLLCDK